MPHFAAWVNPLKCLTIEGPSPDPAPPTPEQLLDYLFAPELDRGVDAFVSRYQEIAQVADPIPIAPAEPNILDKLVWPLRHAKGSYALGNYLACIALCGMVGEMVAILLWDISKFTLQGKEMAPKDEAALFGSAFEKLGQQRRTQVLRALSLIDADTQAAFDSLRETRRRYLHFFSQPHAELAADARQAFEQALKVVSVVLGQTYKKGAVVLRPDLMDYLKEKGIVAAEKEEGGA
jgi:hypothetical protein